ncbi:MAG: MerC domain-containing protein [Verrucomicrobia bacterium]|nr:MerC domain-containing protein [Verrucomicrobiota bacterium]
MNTQTPIKKTPGLHGRIDVLGAAASMICAVHCMALPLLLAILPTIGLGFLLNESLEKGFVVASVLVAGLSLVWGIRLHGRWRAIPLYALGAGLLLLAMFVLGHQHAGHQHAGQHDHAQENPLVLAILLVGAVSMATSHLINRKLCKACPKCHGDCHPASL